MYLRDLVNAQFKKVLHNNMTEAFKSSEEDESLVLLDTVQTYIVVASAPRALYILEKQDRGSEKDVGRTDRVKFSKVPTCLRHIEVH